MPKEFYTERDIEDMVRQGILSLAVNDNVVLTDLAYEKANKLGMQLVRDTPDKPPAAPVRPYLSQPQAKRAPADSVSPYKPPAPSPDERGVHTARWSVPPPPAASGSPVPQPDQDSDLHARIRNTVIARLGSQVDGKLLDVIIRRVLHSTGMQ